MFVYVELEEGARSRRPPCHLERRSGVDHSPMVEAEGAARPGRRERSGARTLLRDPLRDPRLSTGYRVRGAVRLFGPALRRRDAEILRRAGEGGFRARRKESVAPHHRRSEGLEVTDDLG